MTSATIYPVVTILGNQKSDPHGICSALSDFYRYIRGDNYTPRMFSQELGNDPFETNNVLHQQLLAKFCSVHGIAIAIFEKQSDEKNHWITTRGTFVGNSVCVIPILSLGNNLFELLVSPTVLTNKLLISQELLDSEKRVIHVYNLIRQEKTPTQEMRTPPRVHHQTQVPDAPKKILQRSRSVFAPTRTDMSVSAGGFSDDEYESGFKGPRYDSL